MKELKKQLIVRTTQAEAEAAATQGTPITGSILLVCGAPGYYAITFDGEAFGTLERNRGADPVEGWLIRFAEYRPGVSGTRTKLESYLVRCYQAKVSSKVSPKVK